MLQCDDVPGTTSAARIVAVARRAAVLACRALLWSSVVIGLAVSGGQSAQAESRPLLLLDPVKGDVLYSEGADYTWYPASLTKLMTAYLTFEAVKTGRLAWDQPIPLSAHARAQPATRIGLRPGIALNVEQAVRGLILRSANDFAMALAEAIGGSEDAFAILMNDTAKRLGMSRSRFKNPHGLPDPEQVTTARDMARLALALRQDFPDRLEIFSTPQVRIHRGVFHSQNDLLRSFEGANGMKTGFTCGAGYNIVASAQRGDRHVIVVVLGAMTRAERSARAAELMQRGFDHYASQQVLTPVKLAAMPLVPAEADSVHDMARKTQARQCGNRGPRRAVRTVKRKAKDARISAAIKPGGSAIRPLKASTPVASGLSAAAGQ